MPKKNSGFFGFVKSLLGIDAEDNYNDNAQKIESVSTNDTQVNKKMYKNSTPPLRSIFLWGWDNDGNKSFAVLYGTHKLKKTANGMYEPEANVIYTNYIVFSGAENHFPSFEAVKILEDRISRNERVNRMYYKKDIKKYGYWYSRDASNSIKDFVNLSDAEKISIPYYEDLKYSDYVKLINSSNLQFINFNIANEPNEVLKLSGGLVEYYDIICKLFSNPSLYLRKKYLKMLINSNPSVALYNYLLKCGSGELISGLFLELSAQNNGVLATKADEISNSQIIWLNESYAAGLKRCARIYSSSFNTDEKNKKIVEIRQHLSDIDMRPLIVNNTQIPPERILEGADYRRYSNQGLLSAYYYQYSREQRKTIKIRRSNIYPVNMYTDGVALNINRLKNTIQEAEIYGLSDVIGKIAYYLDAPRLTYYFKGNSNSKTLMYFRRYCRRLIDSYAINDKQKFIEAVKTLFVSYTDIDYLCKTKGNFQFNYFIKHYLYHHFTEKAPDNYLEKRKWITEDQLLALTGRYEYMGDLWDRHLNSVFEIIGQVKVNTIAKAFYYILLDNKERLNTYSYKKLISLTSASFEPVIALAASVISEKLENESTFDENIMLSLLNSPIDDMRKLALSYSRRTGGSLSISQLIENITVWTDECTEIFEDSLNKFTSASYSEKVELITSFISELQNRSDLPDFITTIIIDSIFSLQLTELESILYDINSDFAQKAKTPISKATLSFLSSIKTKSLPSDALLFDILDLSTPSMVKAIIGFIEKCKNQLEKRFSTLLIMLESYITPLNDIAKQVFEGLPTDEKKNLHSIIIDSPDKKTYSYGLQKLYEIYEQPNEVIPEEFIIRMLEHSSIEVRDYISGKVINIIKNLGNGNSELFIYYVKTMLFLPNKVSKSKDSIYKILPEFVRKHSDKKAVIEQMLLSIGGSNIKADSERALISLAAIRKEV